MSKNNKKQQAPIAIPKSMEPKTAPEIAQVIAHAQEESKQNVFATFLKTHRFAVGTGTATMLSSAATATTFSLWPAALAAVANYPILGFTLAGLVSGVVPQIAILAATAGLAILALTGVGAALVKGAKAIWNHFKHAEVVHSPNSADTMDFPRDNASEMNAAKAKSVLGLNTEPGVHRSPLSNVVPADSKAVASAAEPASPASK